MAIFQEEKRMLKLGLMVVTGAVLVIAYLFLTSTPKEPADFRGIKWASNIGDLKDMKLLAEEGDHKFFQKENDSTRIGDAEVDKIVYGFYKDRFYSVMIYYRSAVKFRQAPGRPLPRLRETLPGA